MAIMGATVTADSTTSATTAANGIYSMLLPAGSYTVNCHANGYNEQEQENIVITGTMTTVVNFILSPVANDDNVISADTRLLGNYPNPFSSGTSIRYYTKIAQPVHIDIFNSKGQLIRSWQQFTPVGSDGISEIHWNGTDAKGIGVANGIYTFRMSTGGYTASRHMILLK
jgi:hypothetical protein